MPRQGVVLHSGSTAPAVFRLATSPAWPSSSLQPQLDMRSLTFRSPRAAMSRISLQSPRSLLAEQNQASDACSPNGTWLLLALPLQPLSLQCWHVPDKR